MGLILCLAPLLQQAAEKVEMVVLLEAMAVLAAAVLGHQMLVVQATLQAFRHLKAVTEALDSLAGREVAPAAVAVRQR
jgi:hypothetical protein